MIEACFKSFARALRAGGRDRPDRDRRPLDEGLAVSMPREPRIAILDYGMGNLRSVEKALERAGARPCVTQRPRRRSVPADGAGAAGRRGVPEGDAEPARAGARRADRRAARGAACRCSASASACSCCSRPRRENEGAWGLGLLPGRVERLPAPGLKVPHIGWNAVRWTRRTALTEGLPDRVPVLLRALLRADRRRRRRRARAPPATASRSSAPSSASRCLRRPVPPREVERPRPAAAAELHVDLRRRRAPPPESRPQLYPAIDILGGKAVRLEQGDFERRKVIRRRPARRRARAGSTQGARRLHVVDLDGAREGRPVNLEQLERIAAEPDVPVQYGGGLRDASRRRTQALEAGRRPGRDRDRRVHGRPSARRPCCDGAGERVSVALDVRGGRGRDRRLARAAPRPRRRRRRSRAARRAACGGFVYTSVDRDGTLEGIGRRGARSASATPSATAR